MKSIILRKFSAIDLLRFRKFANENPELKPIKALFAYHEKYPELSAKEKIQNIENYFGITIDELIQDKE